jgi:hypothetical protein
MSKEEMSVEERAEFLVAVRNLKCGKRKKWPNGTEFVASDRISDEKVFVRLIEPRSRLVVSDNDIENMSKVMRLEGCDRGVLVGKRFTDATVQKMNRCNIQQFSDEYMPPVEPENMLRAIDDCRSVLCRTRCGVIRLEKTVCENHAGKNLCRVRSIGDDALFHSERGWMSLLKNDLRQLLSLRKIVAGRQF